MNKTMSELIIYFQIVKLLIILFFLSFVAHQSSPNSISSPADFSRHINLHLTYSFQHQQHPPNQQQAQLSPTTCKSPMPSLYQNHGKYINQISCYFYAKQITLNI